MFSINWSYIFSLLYHLYYSVCNFYPFLLFFFFHFSFNIVKKNFCIKWEKIDDSYTPSNSPDSLEHRKKCLSSKYLRVFFMFTNKLDGVVKMMTNLLPNKFSPTLDTYNSINSHRPHIFCLYHTQQDIPARS